MRVPCMFGLTFAYALHMQPTKLTVHSADQYVAVCIKLQPYECHASSFDPIYYTSRVSIATVQCCMHESTYIYMQTQKT